MGGIWFLLKKKDLAVLDIDTIEKILKELSGYNVYYELFGGEPLLHPDFLAILLLIKKYKCKVDIPTNGTLLKKYAKEIVEANIERIWISLDGPEIINDAQRGKNVYKRAIDGIKEIQKMKLLNPHSTTKVGVTFVVTPLNYKYIESFVLNELIPMNLDYISIEFQLFITQQKYNSYHDFLKSEFNITKSTVSSGLIRDIKEFENINIDLIVTQMQHIKEQLLNTDTKLIGYPKYIEHENLEFFYKGKWDCMKEKKKECPFPWVYMEISANGGVTPCHTFYDISMGNVYDESILDIWNSAKYSEFRKKMHHKLTPICPACSRYYS